MFAVEHIGERGIPVVRRGSIDPRERCSRSKARIKHTYIIRNRPLSIQQIHNLLPILRLLHASSIVILLLMRDTVVIGPGIDTSLG